MVFPLEERTIQTNGIDLHCVLAGPPDGQLVVLLHGFPEFWRAWNKQIQPLAEAGFRVVAPDQRGYNLSTAPAKIAAYRLDELELDIVGLLDALERQECCLVGHDWGAAVAWSLASAYPQRIKKLAIMNVPHPMVMMEYLRSHPMQMLKSWYIAFFQIPGLAEWLLSRNQFNQAALMLKKSSRSATFSDQDIAEYKRAWQNSGGLGSMINWYRALWQHRPRPDQETRLGMPVLLQWGKQDAFLEFEMAEQSLTMCDNGRLILYENATHWVQHEQAEQVTQALVAFFNE